MNVRLLRRGLLALSAVLALTVVMAVPASADPHDGDIVELEFCLGNPPTQFCFLIPNDDPTPCPDTPDPSVTVHLTPTGGDTADIDDVDVASTSYAEIPDGSGAWFAVELTDSSFGTTGGDIDLNRTPQVDVDVALEGSITPVDHTDPECPTAGGACSLFVPLGLTGSYAGALPPPPATIVVSGGGTVSAPSSVCPSLSGFLHNAPATVVNLQMDF